MPKKRLLILVLSLAGLVGLGTLAYTMNRSSSGGPAAPGAGGPAAKPGGAPGGFAMAVETARVRAMDFQDEVSAVGTLKSRESVVLRPEVAGRVAAIHFKDGALMGKGSALISLDASVQEAELAQARANLALAQSNYKRNLELLEKKFVSPQAVDNVAATLKIQEAAVQLAEAKVGKTRIKAPFDGVVGLRNVSVGDYVKEGQDLVNMEDAKALKVDFRLPEAYLERLAKGQSLEVTSDALPGDRFPAVLDAVDPLVEQNGRSLSCRARLDNATGRLKPGMFVRVRLLFGQKQGVLMVPEQALVPGNVSLVFKVVEGKAVATPVKVGVRRAAQVEVTEGLAEGDLVVTAGQLKIRDGAPVRPVGEGAPAAPTAAGVSGTAAVSATAGAPAKAGGQ